MHPTLTIVAGVTGALLLSSTASADLLGIGSESYTVTTDNGTFLVIDLFACFDEPTNTLLAVLNAQISLVGAPKWHHNDQLGTNLGAGAGGTWNPQFTLVPPDLADSLVTIGGAGPAFGGAMNTSQFDVGGPPPANGQFNGHGWFNTNPPNAQGSSNDGPFHPSGFPWLSYTMLGRFVIESQVAPASINFLIGATWNDGPGSPAIMDFLTGSADYPCPDSEPGARLLVLLDRTGSMNVVNPDTGDTICTETFTHAFQEITIFSLTDPDGEVSVWTIHGSSVNEETNGFVTPAAANATVAGLGNCAGLTPLADALCDGVGALVNACAEPGEDLRMVIITDGHENSSDGPCSGPVSISEPPPSGNYDIGSWHQRVYDTVIASGIEVSTWYWEPDLFPAPFGGPGVSDEVFFGDLSAASGGYLVYIPFGTAPPPAVGGCCLPDGSCEEGLSVFACLDARGEFQGLGSTCAQCSSKPGCVGDLDGNGVVDGGDLGELLAAWGNNPAGDLSGDGVTDGTDLGLLLAGWGPCGPPV